MRRIVATLAAVGAVLWITSAPAGAADTITGEVIDLACYLGHPESAEKMRGPGHRKCAETCLKKGLPMGLLTEDKQVYLVLEDHEKPEPYAALKEKAAQTVTVEGKKVALGGTQGIVVEAVK